ncbi:LPXTG cell wall anchor domain-containing protein [Staphylococcus pseudintermedius]|nr:LPXTG cell wall anchor domain-containing protein [Staphylococcus pseudintermedius]EGQ3862721.1 LPXTG cell wall anchor domain-containing protein [Staphylococcus pseudintermedius]EGQ3922292.1 peptidase [Staphylococcus pseudintermedius]EII2116964.1 LPXTG cell wall anchor domain-containing protein [Staphylococcus pseudintermedius]EJY6913371.1 LPXTG cell wall anchor domain-containing protein [Staphylococcus pseudintermedius]
MKKTISVLGLGLLATFFVSNESYAAETIQNNTSSSETNQNSDRTPLDHYIRKADGTLVEPNVYPHKDYVENEGPLPEFKFQVDSKKDSSDPNQAPLDHYIRKADGTLVEPNVYPHKDYVENEGPLPEFKFMYADKQNHHDQQSKNNKDKQRANYSDKKHNDQPGHPKAVTPAVQHDKAVTSNATVKALPNTGESDKTTQLPIVLSLLSVGILVLLKLRK